MKIKAFTILTGSVLFLNTCAYSVGEPCSYTDASGVTVHGTKQIVKNGCWTMKGGMDCVKCVANKNTAQR